jgi:hypothetical protein
MLEIDEERLRLRRRLSVDEARRTLLDGVRRRATASREDRGDSQNGAR